MKFKCFFLVFYVVLIPSISAENRVIQPKQLAKQPVSAQYVQADDTDAVQANKLLQDVNGDSDESLKPKTKEKTEITIHHKNKTEPLLKELKAILANATKLSNITEDEAVEMSTPYDVKHYLTAEQKYYMLRINLLGIGIRVVHDIIPIPVANTEQYTESMEVLLDKVQAARLASVNITAKQTTHNITLEDAHKLQMEMARDSKAAPAEAAKKPTSNRTTQVLVLVGVVVAMVIIGVLIFACKRGLDGKSDSPYYDHLQGGGGGVPLN